MTDLIAEAIKLKNGLDIPNLRQEEIFNENYKFYDFGIEYPPLYNAKSVKDFDFLKTNPKSSQINLYAHIPFCSRICNFCNNPNTIPSGRIMYDYLSAFKKEIMLLSENCSWLNKKKVISLYFGGGTPTLLNTKQMSLLIKSIKDAFNFSDDFEFACETTPESLFKIQGTNKLKLLKKEGVNRLSIGVQSFNNSILKNLKRGHTSQTLHAVFNKARKIGFHNINLDMIYGLPYQTLEDWENSLNALELLHPEGIAPTRLRITNPFMHNLYAKNPQIFPSEEKIILMRIMSFLKFSRMGYNAVSSMWFEKFKGHSLHYKYRCLGLPYISLGASSRSFVNNYLYYNFNDIRKYIKNINKGKLPVEKFSKLSKMQLMERNLLQGLYFENGINKEKFKGLFDRNVEEVFNSWIQKMLDLGLIKDCSTSIKLTLKGNILKDHITYQFYTPYLKLSGLNIFKILKFNRPFF